MEKVKSVTKSGWHPSGKDGKKESWRGDFKGINQVAGWVGKGKDPHVEAQEHRSRPLASLKDPSAFGPPPRNVGYHGGAAVPNATTPDHTGLGTPLNTEELRLKEEKEQREIRAAEQADAAPPVPYRADTTGLSTSSLPKPPVRRTELGDQQIGSSPNLNLKPTPSLPPRLPPRRDWSNLLNSRSPPPPPYTATTSPKTTPVSPLNPGALRRLGSAGVNVPGFGIGEGSNVTNAEQSLDGDTKPSPTGVQRPKMNDLHSKFSKLSSESSPSSSPSVPPSQGTTFAQKQAALKTAHSLRTDPSSVSLSDAKAAASTANNLRERHGDQIAAGWKKANAINQTYDLAGKVGGYASKNDGGSSAQNEPPGYSPAKPEAADLAALAIRKKPPPPPPKKVFLEGESAASPPPIPLSSKPRP